MSKSHSPKLALATPETIPLDKLDIHEDNVRKSDIDETAIAELAADIAARGLLQSLSVRPVLDDEGAETGIYGIQAGSRRFRALKLLVKQKKLAKNTPVPCIVKRDGFAEADSLAENTQRQALKPLDEFRAFKAMADKGHGEDTIAAAFRVSTLVVRQRMRLANASPDILEAYENDDISLEQLMAYCLTDNHARQEQVFEALTTYYNKGPDQIRRLLTEKSIAGDDKRALFIGIDAYAAAGGAIERDLFSQDDEGYLIDTDLVNRLVNEKLAAEAESIRAEGWAWVEQALDFEWNHHRDFRAIKPITPALTDDEENEYGNLTQAVEEFESFAKDDLSQDGRERLAAAKAKLAEFDARVPVYSDEQKAKSGTFVSIEYDGKLIIERGYRRFAELAAEQRAADADGLTSNGARDHRDDDTGAPYETDESDSTGNGYNEAAANDDDGAELPEKLLTELTAYHSLGLRNALARDHRIAYLAVLYALTQKLFYRYVAENCLQIEVRDALVPAFPGLGEFKAAQEIDARHEAFQKLLPEHASALWDFLLAMSDDRQQELFAHCVGLTVNGVHDTLARGPNRRRHALRLAEALRLDMGAQGFVTTAENYLGRIKKQQILETVTEAKGHQAASRLADYKKKAMAAEAEQLLADTGWLPEPLRTPEPADETEHQAVSAFLNEPALQAAE